MKSKSVEATSTGGGMSRAAKKRAKKKKKQSEGKRPPTYDDGDEYSRRDNKQIDIAGHNDFGAKRRKKNVEEPSSISTLKDEEKKAEAVSSKTFSSLSESTQGKAVCSDASILEILQLQKCKDESTTEQLQAMTATERAACLLQAILEPITLKEFYRDYFEKKPLVVRGESKKNKSGYSDLLSLESIKSLTRKHSMIYGRDLNVTKYKKGDDGVKRRITLDKISEDDDDDAPRGALVDNSELWSNYENGCTIRLLCPHKYNDAIQSLLSTLELEFQCMVGANAYLTPPRSSQGFAPHYDDIDAYCLQLQGVKRWKVYEPTVKLPRTSSQDFTPEDLEGMEPVLDVTLEEGDLLYMPRGWIHQAYTLSGNNKHSLHLTVSTMQQW
jgi:hypothetical protein